MILQKVDLKAAVQRHEQWPALGEALGGLQDVCTDDVELSALFAFLPDPIGTIRGPAGPGGALHALDCDRPRFPEAVHLGMLVGALHRELSIAGRTFVHWNPIAD